MKVFGSSGCGRREIRSKPRFSILDALDLPASRLLVASDNLDGDPLDLLVTHHRSESWRISLRVRQDPGSAKGRDVRDGAVPFHLQFAPTGLQAVVQLVQVGFSLGDQPVEPRHRLPATCRLR